MEVLKTEKSFRISLKDRKKWEKELALPLLWVPCTMAIFLCMKRQEKENDLVISSIFVNPTQFNNPEDLEKYPRDVNRDILILQNSGLVDAVYIPEVADIYPEKLKASRMILMDWKMKWKANPDRDISTE